MEPKKRNQATPSELVQGYRVDEEDDPEEPAVGGAADLMHALDAIDEHAPQAEFNAEAMKDGQGRTVKFNEDKTQPGAIKGE